jgi:hypothetical protein
VDVEPIDAPRRDVNEPPPGSAKQGRPGRLVVFHEFGGTRPFQRCKHAPRRELAQAWPLSEAAPGSCMVSPNWPLCGSFCL